MAVVLVVGLWPGQQTGLRGGCVRAALLLCGRRLDRPVMRRRCQVAVVALIERAHLEVVVAFVEVVEMHRADALDPALAVRRGVGELTGAPAARAAQGRAAGRGPGRGGTRRPSRSRACARRSS